MTNNLLNLTHTTFVGAARSLKRPLNATMWHDRNEKEKHDAQTRRPCDEHRTKRSGNPVCQRFQQGKKTEVRQRCPPWVGTFAQQNEYEQEKRSEVVWQLCQTVNKLVISPQSFDHFRCSPARCVQISDGESDWSHQRVKYATARHHCPESEEYNAPKDWTPAYEILSHMPASQQTQTGGYWPHQASGEKPHPRTFAEHPQQSFVMGASRSPVPAQKQIANKE
jgi:hypothetical protein